MSSLFGKVERNVELNVPADKFYNMWCYSPNNVSYACPDKVQSCSLVEGEWGKNGSIICWYYSQDGEAKVTKEAMEGIDPKNYRASYRVVEGDLLKGHKSFVTELQVTPKSQGEGCIACWTVEFEKQHEGVASPQSFMDFLEGCSKDCEAHLLQPN